MTQEKWENLKIMIKDKFGLREERTEETELGEREDGTKIKEEKETIEFESPMGRIRLEKIAKPKIINKRTLYSKRIGGKIKVEYIYSEDEAVCQFRAYKWEQNKNQWLEITYNF